MKELARRVHASFFRTGWPTDDRSRLKAMHTSMVLHVHAAKVRIGSLQFRATWAMGFVSMVLFLLLTATGIYLMFYYFPYPGVAYRSMKDLAFVVPFGTLTRNLHRWGAHAMVITVTVHMLRVFLMGGYKTPREANWVAGVLLWFLTLALSFTGYLLPWDQLAFWAVTVGANMMGAVPLVGERMRLLVLGDHIVGESALLRFYVLHCVLLPVLLGGIVAFHVYRVRKDGGLIASEPGAAPEKKPEAGPAPRLAHAWPHLVYRELVIGLTVTAVLALFSLFLDAPLEPEADRTRTPNPAKAPWYFLGIQELAHYSAFWGGVFIPAVVVIGLCALPYFDRRVVAPGQLFPRERRLACWLFIALLLFMAATTVIGTYFRGPGWALMWWPH